MTQVRYLFGGVAFLAAFLLFLVEPMAAKQLLPTLGGSAAVWITCLVFFQAALLIGYLYAHWLAPRTHNKLHFGLLAVGAAAAAYWAAQPLAVGSGSAQPVRTVFEALACTVGLPFLALAATSPLLQVWWTRAQGGPAPYRLYALSNLASLLALAAYPSIVEPFLTLRMQRIVWASGFAAFAVLSSVLAECVPPPRQGPASIQSQDAPAASGGMKLLWLFLPMAASAQLSAVTEHLTANVAAIPLLWILPLGVYLITLVVAFQSPAFLRRGILVRFLVLMLASLAYMLTRTGFDWPLSLTIGFYLLELFAACLFCHCEAYNLRPRRTSETTMFYLVFAAGGAAGSFLVGIIAPLVFRFNYDLPVTFLLTALVALAANWRVSWNQRLLWIATSAAMLALTIMVSLAYQHDTTVAVRNFYGSLRVRQDHSFPGATVRTLLNGSIQHGNQIFATEELRRTPTTYYATDSGVGYALRLCCSGRPKKVGIIGLGAGTLAAYGHPGDNFRFYEINPDDIPIARNVFTYIRESGAQVDIVQGDARTSLAAELPQNFNVLVIDAFSGDAIPLHLLTREAMAIYLRHLAPGGILAFHISNQRVNLNRPVQALARSAGLEARRVSSLSNDARGEFSSTWMLVTANAAFFAQPELAPHAFADADAGARPWTDDYSALLPVLRW